MLKNSPEFGRYVVNVSHINSECVTSKMVKDFLGSDLGENENWVDLAIELKSAKLIKKLSEKIAERAISNDDAELFALVGNNKKYTEEVFKRNKYKIAVSLNDERVEKITAKYLAKHTALIDTGKFVVIEQGVKVIPENAFFDIQDEVGNKSLKYIVIPDSAKTIEGGAFFNCTSLKAITIPPSVTQIGDEAFSGCSSLKENTIPSTVTRIGQEVFAGCSSLKEITIPSSVTYIGDYALNGCSSL